MKNLIGFVLTIAIAMMWTIVNAQSLTIDWNKNITGQEVTGVASIGNDIYTVSIPNAITGPGFTYEIHKWDSTGTSSKIAEGTTNTTPHITATGTDLLIYTVQSESVKVISTAGTVITEKILSATLQLSNLYEASTKYFFADTMIVQAIVGEEVASGAVATRINIIDQDLNITGTIDLDSFELVGIAGQFIVGNINGEGRIMDIYNTLADVTLSSPVTSATMHNNELHVISGSELYQYDMNLNEVSSKSISGTSIHFIGDHPVTMNGSSAILYDDSLSSTLFTLSVPVSIDDITESTDAMFIAGKSLVKIGYTTSGGGTGNGGDTTGVDTTGVWVRELANVSPIILYPNPTVDYISIKGLNNPTVEIINTLGNVVATETKNKIDISFLPHKIDISFLPPGVYFCRTGESVKRFIKNG